MGFGGESWRALDRGIKRLTPNSFFMFITACERSGNLNAAVEAAEQHNVLGFTLYKSSLKQGGPSPTRSPVFSLSLSLSDRLYSYRSTYLYLKGSGVALPPRPRWYRRSAARGCVRRVYVPSLVYS